MLLVVTMLQVRNETGRMPVPVVGWPAVMAAKSPVTVQPLRKHGGPTMLVRSWPVTRGRRMISRSASMIASGRNGGLRPSP